METDFRDFQTSYPINALSIFQTFMLDPENRNESMNHSIAKILHLAAILTNTPDDKFLENIKKIPELILALPSSDKRRMKDETLMSEVNGHIKLVNNINTDFINLDLDAQKDAMDFNPENVFSNIESKLLKFKSSYTKLNSQIMDMLTLKSELSLKLNQRIAEGINKTIPSQKDYNQFSYSHGLKPKESEITLLNLHKRSGEIDLAPSKIENAEKQIQNFIPTVRRNISYLNYLFQNKCLSSNTAWVDFRVKYFINYYNFFDKSIDFHIFDPNSSKLETDQDFFPEKYLEGDHQARFENDKNIETQNVKNVI
ncbi:MAG: hypothetical protein H0T62_12150 [Parachlamydiaceae bacterium]|nr:hypothetical protein [Parachlamydiaceae bacterium]